MFTKLKLGIEPGFIFGLVLATLTVLFFGWTTLARYDSLGSDYSVLNGEVVGYRAIGVEGSPRHQFRVKLENGIEVKIYDTGQLPITYVGPVQVATGKGKFSRRIIYEFLHEQ